MIRSALATVVSVAATLAGCAGVRDTFGSHPLAGTRWALHGIQSMDDAQGTTRVDDPQRFTAEFGTDGRLALRLDCNRGFATWEARAADTASGSLHIGPVAATRALCLPPRLDERVARDLGHLRSYLLRDGLLFMSLMADGGIYEWHPLP